MKKIRCPYHRDKTASLHQYGEYWFCFGSCAKQYTNKEVEEKTGEKYEYEEEAPEPEDIEEKKKYILALPFKSIRSLEFRCDNRGYYIYWPTGDFYKYRLFEPGKGPKYIGPKGHKPPLFWARRSNANTLSVVEGEINALSIAKAIPDWDVCSPGSATMFSGSNLDKYLHIFKEYSNVVVVLDNDAAGTKALIEAKAFLLYKIPFITFIQTGQDANETLCEKGPEALRQALQGSYFGR